MQIDKLKSYLNICKKANYLVIGGEKLENYKHKLYLVLYDKSSQKNTLKIVEKIKTRNITTLQIENLGKILDIDTCKIVGIKNKNLSEIINNIINEN